MSVIELEELLAPVAPDNPCGEDLEYDPAYGELERSASGKEEQQFGDTIVPAEEPNWSEVRRRAKDLLKTSKDLRIAMYLAQSLLHQYGLAGLRDGILLVEGLVERYWDDVHPRLDPDDDNDPTMRINTLMTLCSPAAVLGPLRETPLVEVQGVGRYSLRDVQIAAGEIAPIEEDDDRPDTAAIEAAFAQGDLETLQAAHDVADGALQHAQSLERFVTEKVGAAQAPNFDDLVAVLRPMRKVLHDHLDRRGAFRQPETPPEPEPEANGDAARAETPVAAPQQLGGEIRSREDVIRALDMVCAYYERHEPSSPLPLLINRAKRLATMSFMEIIRELAPDGLGQAETVGGLFGGPRSDDDD